MPTIASINPATPIFATKSNSTTKALLLSTFISKSSKNTLFFLNYVTIINIIYGRRIFAVNVQLVTPTVDLQEEYLQFYQEWKNSGETMIPWVIEKDPSDFPTMVQELLDAAEGKNLPPGWVPDTTYWLVTTDQKIVGAVNIRHGLTEHLFHAGGHIGYGIRPSARQKGYAKKLLTLSLEKLKELGVTKVLIVCDEWNIASEKTILYNGGRRDEDFIEENGNVIRRYWIEL